MTNKICESFDTGLLYTSGLGTISSTMFILQLNRLEIRIALINLITANYAHIATKLQVPWEDLDESS